MLQRIIKSILNFLTFKRTTLLVLLFCISMGLIIPILHANAQFIPIDPLSMSWSPIVNKIIELITGLDLPDMGSGLTLTPTAIAKLVIKYLLIGFLILIVGIGSAFLALAGSLLNAIISPDFISLGYTTNNLFVTTGWALVRGLSNMFVILILVAIALGTALKIKEYEIKKLLPTLIAIALLINFTPVICGLIIDASNIIMYTFLNALGTGLTGAANTFSEIAESLTENLDKTSIFTILGQGIPSIIFLFIAAFIYFAFALLFFVRYAALWILVILSPLAFLCYIMPQTKGIWSAWWKQFTQWCFVGVGGAFFLYLGSLMLGIVSDTSSKVYNFTPEEIEAFTGMDRLYPFIIPIIILIIGFFATLKTSAIGADKVLAFAQGTGKKIGGWTKGRVKESPFVKDTVAKLRARKEQLPEYIPGRIGKEAEMKNKIAREERIENRAKQFEKTAPETSEYLAKSNEDKAAKVLAHARQDKIDEKDEKKDLKDLIYLKQKGSHGQLKEVLDKRPDLAGEKGIIDTTEYKTPREAITAKIQGRSPVKLRQETSAKSFLHPDVVLALSKEQAEEIYRKGNEEQKNNITNTVINLKKKGGLIKEDDDKIQMLADLGKPQEDKEKEEKKHKKMD